MSLRAVAWDDCVLCGGEIAPGELITPTAHPQIPDGWDHDSCHGDRDLHYLDVDTGEELEPYTWQGS